MHIESEDTLSHDPDEVYALVRDEMPKLLPYMPDVESLVQDSYARESDTRVRIVNTWTAKQKIPSAAQRFLPKDILTWKDKALWKDDERLVEYRLEGFGYEVDGTTRFEAVPGGTRIKVAATFTIHPEKFKIPRMVFKRVFPHVEGVVKKGIQPNLTALAKGLKEYYAAQS